MTQIDKLIYDTAINDEMPHPLAVLIVGQARLESGNYLHKFFTIGKNAFGYMYDKNSHWQIAPGGIADNKARIAQYESVTDSVHELTSWIKRRVKDGQFPKDLSTITTPGQYANYLRNGSHVYGGLSTVDYRDGIAARLKLAGQGISTAKSVPAMGSIGLLLLLIIVSYFFWIISCL